MTEPTTPPLCAPSTPRLLFVDDEPRVLDGIRRSLRSTSDRWHLRFAGGVEAAREILLRESVDVVITDWNMPEQGGLVLLRFVAGLQAPCPVPVIVLTGDTEHVSKREALDAGAFDLLDKPVKVEDLIARISSVLRATSYQKSLAEVNATLERKVRERTLALEQSRSEILLCLAMAGECRDNDTGRHVVRVAYYSRSLAVTLGLPHAEVDRVLKASLLHDIGKLGVPDSILRKPGPLTPVERLEMQKHCIVGHRILAQPVRSPGEVGEVGDTDAPPPLSNPILLDAAVIALHHHERWDGTGYPDGLSGTAIPLHARIVAVADVYDAITTVRPYKRAMSHEAAVALIRAGRGSQFDPAVVDAFELSLDTFSDIRQQWADPAIDPTTDPDDPQTASLRAGDVMRIAS